MSFNLQASPERPTTVHFLEKRDQVSVLRRFLAAHLSSRQKSRIRNVMRNVGLYRLRYVEQLVEAMVLNDGVKTFLQIGANDGYFSDPLNLAILKFKLSGTLVEPQTNYFANLQETYCGIPGLEFRQCAITENAGLVRLYSLDCSNGRLPTWTQGAGTLSRETLLEHKSQIPEIEEYIRATDVKCMTVAELLAGVEVKNPEILAIDAEGHDYTIIKQFNFNTMPTKLIIFEVESLHAAERAACFEKLDKENFALVEAGQDVAAIRRSTATFKNMAPAIKH